MEKRSLRFLSLLFLPLLSLIGIGVKTVNANAPSYESKMNEPISVGDLARSRQSRIPEGMYDHSLQQLKTPSGLKSPVSDTSFDNEST